MSWCWTGIGTGVVCLGGDFVAIGGSETGALSFRIVADAVAAAIVAPFALLKTTWNVLFSCMTGIGVIGIEIVFVVSPGAKVSVPLVAV